MHRIVGSKKYVRKTQATHKLHNIADLNLLVHHYNMHRYILHTITLLLLESEWFLCNCCLCLRVENHLELDLNKPYSKFKFSDSYFHSEISWPLVKLNFFIPFLGILKITKRHFEINWPLESNLFYIKSIECPKIWWKKPRSHPKV